VNTKMHRSKLFIGVYYAILPVAISEITENAFRVGKHLNTKIYEAPVRVPRNGIRSSHTLYASVNLKLSVVKKTCFYHPKKYIQ